MKVSVSKPSKDDLEKLGVFTWPIWTCGPSRFAWSYDETETCYILEGRATVSTPEGDVEFGAGDLVIFQPGLSCTWTVHEAIRKHYEFS
jgi:hypothetical protein